METFEVEAITVDQEFHIPFVGKAVVINETVMGEFTVFRYGRSGGGLGHNFWIRLGRVFLAAELKKKTVGINGRVIKLWCQQDDQTFSLYTTAAVQEADTYDANKELRKAMHSADLKRSAIEVGNEVERYFITLSAMKKLDMRWDPADDAMDCCVEYAGKWDFRVVKYRREYFFFK